MPKVSVIMPAYNAEKYIQEAIDSILLQTFQNFELIVLNDCSRDQTEAIILSYDDPRLVYVKNEKNMGVAATLNRGLEIAKGQYIARMDADDVSLPQRLEKQVQYLDTHKDIAVLGTNVETFDENGPLYTGWSATDPRQMKVDLLFSCGLAHPSVMMRKSVIMEQKGYDLSFEGLEDYQLWCRVSRTYGITTLPDILLRYRVHSSQVTKNPSEEYLYRLRLLKDWQLKQLEIQDEEICDSFFQYCRGQRPENAEQLRGLVHCFEAIVCANEQLRVYAPKILKSTCRGVLLGQAAQLDQQSAKEICAATRMITMNRIRWNRIKGSLRKKLGR